MSNAPSKPVSFSRPKVGYFSNRPTYVIVPAVLQYNTKYSAVKLHVPTQIMKCCHLYGYEAGKRFL